MLKKIFEKNSKWTITGLLLFTQMHAFGSCYDPFCTTSNPANTCSDQCWVDAEYLYWNIKNSPEPVPVIIEGPKGDKFDSIPYLGEPGTSVVLGGKSFNNNWRSGGKFAIGYWFDDDQCYGAEATYFFLPGRLHSRSVISNGSSDSAVLSAPFYNVETSKENSLVVAFPDQWSAVAKLKVDNHMQGAELNALATLPRYCGLNFTALGGFRYWNFQEHLTFTTSSPYTTAPFDIYKTKDTFDVQNNFYGGQIGLFAQYECNNFFVTAKTKVALGAICGESMINGHLFTNDYNHYAAVIEYPGGYYALPTNIGKHRTTQFAVLPEVNLGIGFQFLERLRVEVGYTFLFINNVLWAGNQIDRNINGSQAVNYTGKVPSNLVGEVSPKAKNKTANLWVQGLNAGLVFQF